MSSWRRVRDERGVALVLVLFAAVVVGAISAGAALVGGNTTLINRYSERQSTLVAAADAGLEETRSRLNGDSDLYPDSGYAVLESGAAVYDADGAVIPGVRRWIYTGPTGVTSGQYGVFGSILVRVEDQAGNEIVRRAEVAQESFAKYAYFTDIEPSNISFGGGDQIQGPVHTNDYLKIYPSGATFLGTVETAETVVGPEYGTFAQGYTENAPYIPMPETADLTKLETQGSSGGTAFVGSTAGGIGEATTRIEFVALDLNGDGQTNGDNEGFIKVYQVPDGADADYVVGGVPDNYGAVGLRNSVNCGGDPGTGWDVANNLSNAEWFGALTGPQRRCYLGGAAELNGGVFDPTLGPGGWVAWGGGVDPLVSAAVGGTEAQYLIPINRQMNPSFKGVIYVQGRVAISGTLRGQVTLAATDDIIIADDVVYATNPGAGTCNDILGLFAGDDVMVADNTLNAPVRPQGGTAYRTYDDTTGEFIHGVVLALDIFTVQNYNQGSTNAQPCEATVWGRGCLYLTGGIIQRVRGAVGTTSGTGSLKRYSYDQCAFSSPPPYFPTTGHFRRGRYFEVDPTGFDVDSYWQMLTPPSN